MKKAVKITIAVALAVLLTFGLFKTYQSIMYSINERLMPNTQQLPYYSDEYTDLVVNFEKVEQEYPVVVSGGEILIKFDVIKQYIDPYIHYDEARSKVVITTLDKTIWLSENDTLALINKSDLRLDTASRRINDELYVPARTFADLWQVHIKYIEEFDIVIVESYRNHNYTARVNIEDAPLRVEASIKQPLYVENLSQNELMYVIHQEQGWTKLMTENGIIGYVESDFLDVKVEVSEVVVKKTKTQLKLPQSVMLAWHYVHTSSVTKVPYYADINVMSPTFFTVVDRDGNISSSASLAYMENAKKRGYIVWPLINNVFADRGQMSEVLADVDKRKYVIEQILAYAYILDFDGINIDFENLYLADKDNLTQFVRELVPLAHEAGLAVSIDVGIPGGSEGYSLCYDHKELGKAADFVMVMTYDQFWAGHEQGGSQAQLSWMETNLKKTLGYIPKEKLVMGVPAYTRLWKTDSDGNMKLDKTLTIDDINELLEEKSLVPVWEEERDGFISGQYYLEYTEDGSLYRAWIENAESARLRGVLADKYDLKGICVWMLSQTNKLMWQELADGYYSYD